eukprot:scaffold46541_cov57-Phaeocystis_antarctica.AAC.4
MNLRQDSGRSIFSLVSRSHRCTALHTRPNTWLLPGSWLRHQFALPPCSALCAGGLRSVAARSKCAAASISSAAERGPTSQASLCPGSTTARMTSACKLFGAALTTLADIALSPSSFHHSGLATSQHSLCTSMLKAAAVAFAQYSEPTGSRSLASRYRCAASNLCPEWLSAFATRLKYAVGSSGSRAMASR